MSNKKEKIRNCFRMDFFSELGPKVAQAAPKSTTMKTKQMQ